MHLLWTYHLSDIVRKYMCVFFFWIIVLCTTLILTPFCWFYAGQSLWEAEQNTCQQGTGSANFTVNQAMLFLKVWLYWYSFHRHCNSIESDYCCDFYMPWMARKTVITQFNETIRFFENKLWIGPFFYYFIIWSTLVLIWFCIEAITSCVMCLLI